MIEKAERFFLPTANGARANIVIDPKGRMKDFAKITIDGKMAAVPISALYKLILMMVSEDKQEDLVPTRSVRRRTFKKTIGLRIPKHLKPGELYFVPVEMSFDLPDDAVPVSNYVSK